LPGRRISFHLWLALAGRVLHGDHTLTTIGYQETHPLSSLGRAFNLVLIFFGVGLVFLAIGALTQALLEFELRSFLAGEKMERDIDRLGDHYIICGAGRVGRSAARELARKPVSFVILENSDTKAARLQRRVVGAGGGRHQGADAARGAH